jgi:hypothetical protein
MKKKIERALMIFLIVACGYVIVKTIHDIKKEQRYEQR